MKLVDITEDQLAKDWTLSEQDLNFVLKSARLNVHQIRCAIQLCLLRKTGHFITKPATTIALKAINYLAYQLGSEPFLSVPRLEWSKADYPRFLKIQDHLGYKGFDDEEKQALQRWLVEQVQAQVLNKKDLIIKAKEYLRVKRVVLPSSTSLGRFIARAINKAHLDLYHYISKLYPEKDLPKLDTLINSPENSLYTELMTFKRPPPEPNATVISQFLSYFDVLEDLKITECNLSGINPKVIEHLAYFAKNQSSWHLRRIKPDEKRYAILICFLVESAKTILDTILDMHSLLLGGIERKSKNEFKNKRISMIRDAKSSREKTLTFAKQALSYESPEQITLANFLATFNRQELQEAVDIFEKYEAFEEKGIVTNIAKRFAYLRKYSKEFIKLNFEAAVGNKPLLNAINILRDFHKNKKFPKNPPTSFLPKPWRDNLYDDQGKLQINYWEMGVYYAMRKSLNKGDLYLTDSRHHRYFWDTVYQQQDWENKKQESYATLALPTAFDPVESKLRKEFEQSVRRVQENLGKDGFATIVDDRIKLCKADALEISSDVKQLKRHIESALPLVRIERLIAEVDKLTQFSKAFVPLQQDRTLLLPTSTDLLLLTLLTLVYMLWAKVIKVLQPKSFGIPAKTTLRLKILKMPMLS